MFCEYGKYNEWLFAWENVFLWAPLFAFQYINHGNLFQAFHIQDRFVVQCKHYFSFGQSFYSAMIGDKGILTFLLREKKREKPKAALQNLVWHRGHKKEPFDIQ